VLLLPPYFRDVCPISGGKQRVGHEKEQLNANTLLTA